MIRPPPQFQLRRAEQIFKPRTVTPTAESAKPKSRLVAWRPFVKGSLRGFAAIELPIGLTITDIPVLVSHSVAWAALPSKPQLDQDGRHRRNENGKLAYSPILQWRDKDLSKRFSAIVVELVRDAHPGDLEGADRGHQAKPDLPDDGVGDLYR
jgi:hypothetical protein